MSQTERPAVADGASQNGNICGPSPLRHCDGAMVLDESRKYRRKLGGRIAFPVA